ncbi:glycyl-radical enzyme activating protein [Desulfosarcina sp.]|uniref:glycyl-radical enzyme activating protein n=1 Tax=Desulfosarcina sp. TaxID=2027861 RepID=UPI003567B17D
MAPDTEGIIFDINRYAIHDGPGIRTTVFFKGCPIRCRWCANPESQKTALELAHLNHECILCGRCMETCPQDAIRVSDTNHLLDRTACDLCGKCVEACPAEALQVMGRTVSVDDLYAEVAADRPFWERSGGGVTLSGGEPLFQPRFVKAFLERCRANYIHTAIESCLHVATQTLAEILPLVNTVICDMKLMDDQRHRQFTGVSNALILKNMAMLLQTDQDMRVRMPLIPGVNDDLPGLEALGAFLQDHREGAQLELMPYHRLGEVKYARLGRSCKMEEIPAPSREEMEKAAGVLDKFRINLVTN